MEAACEIPYLTPGQWLGNNTIDRYLLQHWLKIKNESPVLYLNTYHAILCSRLDRPSSQECKTVRRSLLLPEDGMVPLRPVAFVIYNHETRHYFTVVMNYKSHHITTYGHHISSENAHYAQEPEKWAGPYIWKNVCTLFNWELPARKPTYWAIDWQQVRKTRAFSFFILCLDLFIRMAMIVVP